MANVLRESALAATSGATGGTAAAYSPLIAVSSKKLVDRHDFMSRYAAVQRFVRSLRKTGRRHERPVAAGLNSATW